MCLLSCVIYAFTFTAKVESHSFGKILKMYYLVVADACRLSRFLKSLLSFPFQKLLYSRFFGSKVAWGFFFEIFFKAFNKKIFKFLGNQGESAKPIESLELMNGSKFSLRNSSIFIWFLAGRLIVLYKLIKLRAKSIRWCSLMLKYERYGGCEKGVGCVIQGVY